MAGLAESTYALACGGREQRVAVSRRRQLHSAPTRARRARSGGGEEQLRLTTGRGLPESCRSSTGGYALLGLAGSEAQLTGSVEEGSVRRVVDTRAELLPIQCQRPGLRLPCRFKALGALTKSVAAAESYTLRGHPDPRSCHLGGGFDERSSVIIATHTRREKPCTAPATSMAARHPEETPRQTRRVWRESCVQPRRRNNPRIAWVPTVLIPIRRPTVASSQLPTSDSAVGTKGRPGIRRCC